MVALTLLGSSGLPFACYHLKGLSIAHHSSLLWRGAWRGQAPFLSYILKILKVELFFPYPLALPLTRHCNLLPAVAAKSLQSCLTLCDPIDGRPPGSPSLGLSRQEHWSGLPFPSPMHENEKWKWRRSVVSDSSQPHGLQPTRLLRPWDFPCKSTGVGCHCLLCHMYLELV